MGKSGPAFYDNDAIFATYVRRRQDIDTLNDTLGKPVILELIGDIASKSVLDLGCIDWGCRWNKWFAEIRTIITYRHII